MESRVEELGPAVVTGSRRRWQRQADERERRKQSQGAKRRRPGKRKGSAGSGPEM